MKLPINSNEDDSQAQRRDSKLRKRKAQTTDNRKSVNLLSQLSRRVRGK